MINETKKKIKTKYSQMINCHERFKGEIHK